MNFGLEEDEPDFSLTPGARSRLSSLFQGQEPADENPNQSLVYTAPKQPKKQDQQASAAAGQLKLLHAVPVHMYILESGKYSSQGQAGAAILGNYETSEYKLLLYKGKQQKITYCSINANFSYRVQENNYANFYDDRKVNWSIMFDSDKSSIEFAKQVALAKANSYGNNLNSTIIQDLIAGEGTVVLENGGSAEVQYTGWIFSSHVLQEVFDSNVDSEKPLRLRMGKSKMIKGWSGLLGSKRGTKRLVIIPPAFAYGSEGIPDKVPPNAVVVYEFYVMKVREAKEPSSLSQSPAKAEGDMIDRKPEISPKPHAQSISEETIRMRGASISEQLMQSPKKGNATIISRMAKMGTATLPFAGAIAAQPSSESEAEDECYSKSDSPTPPIPATRSRESSPKPVPKPRSSSGYAVVTHSVHPMPAHGAPVSQINQVTSSHPLPVYVTASVPSQQHVVSDTFPLHVYPQASSHAAYPVMQPTYAAHPLPAISPTVVPSMTDSHLTMLLTETRSQNTEVRLSLSKISDKVETVLQKVEGIKSHEVSHNHSSLHYMESNVLMQNVQRIIQENTRLKEDVEIKNSKIQSLNEKICDLLQKNQRFFEESNSYLEQRTESSLTQSRILTLEQEKAKLVSEVQDALSKVSALQLGLEKSKTTENELSEKLKAIDSVCKRQQGECDSLKLQCSEKENLISSMLKTLQEAEQEKRNLLEKVSHLEQRLDDLELIKRTLEETINEKETQIKEVKERSENQIRNLHRSFEDKQSATSHDKLEQALRDKEDLQNKLQELQNQYEMLQQNSSKQKDRFDKQIVEMKNRMRQVLIAQASAQSSVNSPGSESDFDIKKTMNVLYRLLQTKIKSSESYGGEEILKISLETIRSLTARVLAQKQKLQSTQQLENSDESVKLSAMAAHERPESTVMGVSPPKSCSSTYSRSSEDQRSKSSSSASPQKSDTALNSRDDKMNAEKNINIISKYGDALTNVKETVLSTEHSLSSRTETQEIPVEDGFSDKITSELPAEKTDSLKSESTKITESSQIQEEQNEEEQMSEAVINTDTVSESSKDRKSLDVQQENAEDRKTPDVWKPQPPPLPLFDDDEDDDDWLK